MPVATIKQGNVRVSDNDAKYLPTGNAIITDYMVINHYESDRHIYQMGITSPFPFQDASAAFVQLAAPTLLWICDWTASRAIQQPSPPDPAPADPNWVLLDVIPQVAMVTLCPDGVSPLYRISGTYVYGHKNPSQNVFNNLSYARPPWMKDDFPRNINVDILEKNIIDVAKQTFVGNAGLTYVKTKIL